MTDTERNILETLTELESGVAEMRGAAPKPNLVPLFERLTAYSKTLPRDTHGRLIHYLSNGSYEKARLWLLGRDAENGRSSMLYSLWIPRPKNPKNISTTY